MKPSLKKSRERNTKTCIKRKIYTEENLQKVLHEISKGMSKKLAAKTFSVPRSTIQFRMKHPDHRSKPGPSTILTDEEELLFVDWIKISSKKGFPKRKEDLVKSVSDFIHKSGRASSFKNGEKWFKLFLARHPTVTFRTPEAVTGASSTISESDVRGWFKQIRIYMTENNYYNILADPSRVFNGDETNFVLCPKTGIVLSSKGEKNVYEIDHAQAKTSLTVMFTFGADGQLTPPMVIFPNKRLPGEITSKIPEDWGVGLSDNGWMNSDVFFEYIKNVLHPHLVKTGTQFPVKLFVDGHKSHLTFAISELCTSLSIILIALYPNCTRLLQPADVAAFKPLKTQWQKTVLEWRRNNPSQALTKIQFVPLLKDTIDKSVKASTIINGFRATGLCPFNADAVDYSKCLGTANKNNNALTQPRHVTDDRVLTKDDFIKLLGESAIHKIDKKELRPEESSDYLLKIWNFFTTSPNDLQVSSSLETVNQNGNIGKFDIENMEIIFNNSPNQNVAEQSFDLITQEVVFEEIVQCSEVNDFTEDISAQQPFNQLESMEHISSPKASTSLQHPSISQPSFTYVPSTEQPTTPHLSTETSIYQTSVSNQQQLSIYTTPQKPSIRVTGDVKIGADQNNCMQLKAQLGKKDNKVIKLLDILVLPKTPQRKGIKNTKKTPFVLTSAEWKAQENEKIKIKEEKAEGVKKRKEEREQKKLEKEKKVVKKNKKNTKAKDNVTKMLFSEDFYKLDNGKLEAALEEMNKENQKAGTSKNYSAAEIEKMLTETDSDD